MASFSIRNAVRLALGAGVAAAMTAPAAVAQDEEGARELDRVQVTGSRITRTQLEGATPVVTLSREDIDATGYQSVADVLRNNSFNVFGSARETSGNTGQGQATVSMRGLGSSRTLVLLNGRRLPGSPVMNGQAQNLNNIPFQAVERIEILGDGASAVYGSDAVGGVINIILREDFEGADITWRETVSDREGGDERMVSVTGGVSGARGSITYNIEHNRKDVIFTRDRHWARATGFDNDLFELETTGQSLYAKNILSFGRGQTLPLNDACELTFGDGYHFYTNATDPWFGTASPEGLCAYDHTRVSAITASTENTSIFMDARYDVNDDLQFFATALHARTESFGRYAPAAAAVGWNAPTLPESTIQYEGQTVTLNELQTGDFILLRADMIGPSRDTEQFDYVNDITLGLDGFHGGLDWDVAFQHQTYNMHEWGRGYINQLGINELANSGWDPRLPLDMQLDQFGEDFAGAASNSDRLAEMVASQVDFGLALDGPMMGGGPMAFFVGGEYRDEEYIDQAMHQLEAGNVGGSAGGSSGGTRDRSAVFGEVMFPLTDTFEADLAVRYDDYSDFGSNVSSKVSARWQPNQSFVLRGSVGDGFRAPSLDQLFRGSAWSAAFAADIPTCMGTLSGQGGAVQVSDVEGEADFEDWLETCSASNTQVPTVFGANPDLDAETSTQFALGTVFDFSEMIGQDLSLSLDYYYVEIEDVITDVTAQDVMWMYFNEGIPLCSDPSYVSGACFSETAAIPGQEHQAQPTNFKSFDTSGLDINLNYGTDLGGLGRIGVDWQTSYVLEYNARFTPASELQDYTELTVPKYRSNLTLNWSVGSHAVNWHTQYIPRYCQSTSLDPNKVDTLQAQCTVDPVTGNDREIAGWVHHNLSYSYHTPFNSSVTLGVKNVTDNDPQWDVNNTVDTNLYPIVGRQYVVQYSHRF